MKLSYVNNKTEVLDNGDGKGRGVYASKDIKKGEIIEIAPVLYIPANEMPLLDASILRFYAYGAADDEYAAVIGLGTTSMYNHANNANADFIASSKVITLTAKRDIKAGKEITIDYEWDKTMWKSAKLARK